MIAYHIIGRSIFRTCRRVQEPALAYIKYREFPSERWFYFAKTCDRAKQHENKTRKREAKVYNTKKHTDLGQPVSNQNEPPCPA